MKVVYSFIPHNYTKGKGLNYRTSLLLYLSVVQSRKFYKEVVLYTSKEIAHQVKILGIPFTSVDTITLSGESAKCPSIPKLKTYSAQKEPFIHLDLDTILFNPILGNPNSPVTFAYLDLPKDPLHGRTTHESYQMNRAYIYPFSDNVLPEEYGSIKLGTIPNMNIVYCNDPEVFNKAVSESLKLYYDNKDYFDEDYYRFCTIEQLSIHASLFSQNTQYRDIVLRNEHVLHKEIGFTLNDKSLPYRYKVNSFYGEREFFTEDKNELLDHLKKENFGGYLHLIGELKSQHPLIHELVDFLLEKHGENKITQNIKNYFQNHNSEFFIDSII